MTPADTGNNREDSFETRITQHDKIATRMVEDVFKNNGFDGFLVGTETDTKSLYASLRKQSDPTSLMMRFRPDRIMVGPNIRSVLCEIKSDDSSSPNYALEIDSYKAAIIWNQGSEHVMFCFVDIRKGKAYGIWADKVPMPDVILMPKRWDFNEQHRRMKAEWSGVKLKAIKWAGGSGTPFMLVAKNHPGLRSLNDFIVQELKQKKTADDERRRLYDDIIYTD